ncbi:hypothetical protein ACJJIW_15745 [Microbulbifer sp. JMSA004]|uniref:hypothetical protein n=1 Tax=unclassified Microbulbifer TaxID=2619833 RepID=UPI0024ADDD8A|nr:hypothetical protein [Microbulbifer sp. VAAF005]WHI47537.1 hypothetical protein P0078_03875 [Microbulbifer sp. VAAF005]
MSFELFPRIVGGIFFFLMSGLVHTTEDIAAASTTHLELRFAQAEIVAQVEVIDVHRDVDSALSEDGVTAISGYIYSAVPSQVWKGPMGGEITFRLGFESCDIKLEQGENYLIFANLDSYGRLHLKSCEAVIAESDATAILAQLNEFIKQG